MGSLRPLGGRLLDLALPARCTGCEREGAPICPACLPALDARLGLPAGTPIGLPADVPQPLLQVEWCAPFGGLVRRALHELKYTGERRLAEQERFYRWLHGWLLVHVPLSMTLLLLSLVHAVISLRY